MNKKALSSLILISFLIVSIPCVFAQDNSYPQIIHLEGLVSVKAPGASWVSAKLNTPLESGSTIKTHDQAYCDVALDDSLQNVLSLGPNSEMTLDDYLAGAKISKGRVFAALHKLKGGSQFEVATPQAIAGVRGTEWETVVDVTSKFNVNKNTIYVQGVDNQGNVTGEQDVAQGKSITVDENGWMGELTQLTKADKERLDEWSRKIMKTLNLSSEKKKCLDLVNAYSGASANLYEQVLSCEASVGGGGFAAAPGAGDLILGGGNGNGGLGSDITINTFTDNSPPQPPPCSDNISCAGR